MRKQAFPTKALLGIKQCIRIGRRRFGRELKRAKPPNIRSGPRTTLARLRSKRNQKLERPMTSEERIWRAVLHLNQLQLGFLAPALPVSSYRLFKCIRAMIGTNDRLQPCPNHAKRASRKVFRIEHHAGDSVYWHSPNHNTIDLEIYRFLYRMNELWQKGAFLALPSYWPVFTGIDWEDLNFDAITTDSSPKHIGKDPSLIHDAKVKELRAKGLKQSEFISIGCLGRDLYQARPRAQWELLTAIHPSTSYWLFQEREKALKREATRHAGRTDFNQTSANKDIWPQIAVSGLLESRSFQDLEQPAEDLLEELACIHTLGRLITNLVSTDIFPAYSHVESPKPRRNAQSNIANHVCRATLWDDCTSRDLGLPLFAAHYIGENETDAIHVLWETLRPMMVIFILYYLDSRKAEDECIPWWLVLFGVIYDEKGISIRAYYPIIRVDDSASSGGSACCKEDNWSVRSRNVSMEYLRQDMLQSPDFRSNMFGPLYRIQGHCRYVLEQLKQWKGFVSALKRSRS